MKKTTLVMIFLVLLLGITSIGAVTVSVTAPKSLIQASEEQLYAVKVDVISGSHAGFTVGTNS